MHNSVTLYLKNVLLLNSSNLSGKITSSNGSFSNTKLSGKSSEKTNINLALLSASFNVEASIRA